MPKLKLSLIIPIYNAEKDLPDLFSSILYQNRPFDEVILIDNNSQDRSYQQCKDFQEKNSHCRIVVLKEEIPGPGPARNRGISASTGNIISFTDSDCVMDKDFARNVEMLFLLLSDSQKARNRPISDRIFALFFSSSFPISSS